MASLRGLVLLSAVHIRLVASLKTKSFAENAWLFQDLINKPKVQKSFPAPNWCSAKVTSNLGGLGPDTDEEPTLHYYGIQGMETDEGVDAVDIVVTALNGYRSQNPVVNGFNNKGSTHNENAGCFGIINLDSTDGGTSVDLEFKFVESGTTNPVHVSLFEFLLYDIDMGENGTAVESVTVYDDIKNYLKSPTCAFSESGDRSTGVTFTATSVGEGADNPQDPDNLTPEQIDKTFISIYEHIDKFKLTFGVTEGGGGRNFMFSGRTMPVNAPENKPECQTGSCVIWGDPHIITFDLNQEHLRQHPSRESLFRTRNWELDELSVHDTGTFWLVNSSTVHMQGRYAKDKKHPDMTSLDAFAVGGPFLDDNVLVFKPLSGVVTWNSLEILPSLPSNFTNRYVAARYHKGAEMVKDGSMAPAIDVDLPNGVKLTINRWLSMLEVKIDMCLEEGQDGQCGNFNDDVTDDNEEQIMTRIGQKLLPHEDMIERFSRTVGMVESMPVDTSTDAVTGSHDAKNASEILIATTKEKHAEASTDAAPECKDWCETHMDAWDTKCRWASLACGTCEACVAEKEKNDILIATLRPKDKHVEASTGECRSWCETHMDTWGKKCGWPSNVCNTCEACVTDQETHDAKEASETEIATSIPSEEKPHASFPLYFDVRGEARRGINRRGL